MIEGRVSEGFKKQKYPLPRAPMVQNRVLFRAKYKVLGGSRWGFQVQALGFRL